MAADDERTDTDLDRVPGTRLVRTRSGRLIVVPEPAPRPERRTLSRRARILLWCAGGVALVLLIRLYVTTQGTVGSGGPLESILRDFGYVIREVRGPGIVR